MIVLGQQDGQGKPHVAGAGNGDVQVSSYRLGFIRKSIALGGATSKRINFL